MAVRVNDLIGALQMDHDGWKGTLNITTEVGDQDYDDGACTYHAHQVSGTWTGDGGLAYRVLGKLGGKDEHRKSGEPCPASGRLFVFTIAFPGTQPPQRFEAYVFTREKTRMAGKHGGGSAVRLVRGQVSGPCRLLPPPVQIHQESQGQTTQIDLAPGFAQRTHK